jgi:hypothetical protein
MFLMDGLYIVENKSLGCVLDTPFTSQYMTIFVFSHHVIISE